MSQNKGMDFSLTEVKELVNFMIEVQKLTILVQPSAANDHDYKMLKDMHDSAGQIGQNVMNKWEKANIPVKPTATGTRRFTCIKGGKSEKAI